MRAPHDVLSLAVAAADLVRRHVIVDDCWEWWEVDVRFENGLAGSWWVGGSVRLQGARVVVA